MTGVSNLTSQNPVTRDPHSQGPIPVYFDPCPDPPARCPLEEMGDRAFTG
ncbi:hypothetical protein ACFFX0_25550 [Citricoccus parietis]|uniref:Uncharacterized protein n=1 Tax=Citricoccus parietis TaxID=592307 RepID=A0ABV5G659_9MICC